MVNVAVLVSGGGTNLQALIDAQQAGNIKNGRLCAVISSKQGAFALERAHKAQIPAYVLQKKDCADAKDYEQKLIALLESVQADLIVLAGYMTVLSSTVTARFQNRILNVHPSLIPSFCGDGFYGLRVHEAALAKGVRVTGATVHFVNEITDGGAIILQKAVEILPDDTAGTLQKRVMTQAEHILLPQAVSLFCQGKIRVENGKTYIAPDEEKEQMNRFDLQQLLETNAYPGRGIVLGRSADNTKAVIAYFIMGRSENSRNRVFTETKDGIRTEAHDPTKMTDPTLIIYHPVRVVGERTIVTNGDQTDTVREALVAGKSYIEALRTREFEPDSPNFTPRISGVVEKDGSYALSILKSLEGDSSCCKRFFFEYDRPKAGLGHFIHTYRCDGDPLPSFEGEPETVRLPNGAKTIADLIWDHLNEDNKVSLFVRTIDLATGETETILRNKHQ